MEEKEILLVSDFVGVGQVALSMMIPIVNTMEARASYLPTAIVSNNFDFGKSVIEDLTDFMEETKDVWRELDFQFDIINTGIIMNTRQVDIIKEIIDYHDEKPLVISDPIMGDNGKLYKGLSPEIIEASRKIVLEADIIIPNLTEFSMIVGREIPDVLTDDTLVKWLNKARGRGVKSGIITSVVLEEGYFVYGFEEDGDIFRVEYRNIPIDVGGSGDIFTSLIIGAYSRNPDLKAAVEYATVLLSDIIEKEYNKGGMTRTAQLNIQNYLQDIYKSLK